MSDSAATRDGFLERCLGYPVFRLQNAAALEEGLAQASSHPRWMLEAKVAVGQVADVAALTARGFRVIDTNVQLERPAGAFPAGARSARHAQPADEAAVRAVAATSFSQTRFHLDPRIGGTDADRVKEQWAGNFFAGKRGEWMIVAEDGGRVAGFLQAFRTANRRLVIDLIGVEPGSRSKGLGRSMIPFAGQACLGAAAPMIVGTQVANLRSLRLYESLGFRVMGASYVLHLHREDLR
jgi:ribosomal protein S18 acetylase RimI-like enzyme